MYLPAKTGCKGTFPLRTAPTPLYQASRSFKDLRLTQYGRGSKLSSSEPSPHGSSPDHGSLNCTIPRTRHPIHTATMSQPESKRVKTDEAPYELIYWGGLPGRGEFIRLLFEEAGVPYSDDGKNAGEAAKKVLGLLSGETPIGNNPPPLAPPILRHGDVLLSQTSNIMQYLAPKLGLAPSEGPAVYHLNQIVLTLMDGFVNEMHDTHHAIAVALTYEEQQPESDKRAKYYLSGRLPKYLAYAQSLFDAKTSGEGPWLYGSNLTYADLVLFQVRNQRKRAMLRQLLTNANRPSTERSMLSPRAWRSSRNQVSMMACSSCTMRSRSGQTSRSISLARGARPMEMASGDTIPSSKRGSKMRVADEAKVNSTS